jgi:SecDF, P1 head subdomain
MKTIKELLQDADPLRHEPAISSSRREALRQAVVAAGSAPAAGAVSTRFRAARLATVSVIVVGILLLGSRLVPRMGFEAQAAVRFEIRLAEETPAPGLLEAKVPGSGRSIYLHPQVVVGNGDIARAEVMPSSNALQFVVGVSFTADGARKMRAATQNHIGKPVAILIDDQVVMAPTVRSLIGDRAEINGNFTRERADQIAKGLQ